MADQWQKMEPGCYVQGAMTICLETAGSVKTIAPHFHTGQKPAPGWWLWTGREYKGPFKSLKAAQAEANREKG